MKAYVCAYCGGPERMGFNRDHVIPRSLQKKMRALGRPVPEEWNGTVWACFPCNIRKGTRRLVPRSWADRLDALNAFFGGVEWRTWDGDTLAPAYRDTHYAQALREGGR